MDPESKGVSTRVQRLRRLGKLSPPSKVETEAIIKSEFKDDGKNATFFKPEELETIANGPLGDKPLGEFTNSIQEALKLLKRKNK